MLTKRLLPLAACLLLGGCIKQALLNGQIEGTRQGSVAFDSIGDWEMAYNAASNGVVQFEGMHVLAPDNLDALFMLTKSYAGFAYGFAEDDMENAEDAADRGLAEYHKRRAMFAYQRSIDNGLELWEKRGAKGFAEAKANEASLRAWLDQNFSKASDAPDLLWIGTAILSRTNLMKDDAEAVANLFVPVAILEKSRALDPAYNGYSAGIALGSYHARSATAELDDAKALFEETIASTQRKSLIVLFNYATKYACAKADAALYQKLLDEVVAAEDPSPAFRLTNTIAQRRARRWLSSQRMFDSCSIEPVAAETKHES